MLQPVEDTIKQFFDRFGVHASKTDNGTAIRLLASEIYLQHIYNTAKAAITNPVGANPAKSSVIGPKRQPGRAQKAKATKKTNDVAKTKVTI